MDIDSIDVHIPRIYVFLGGGDGYTAVRHKTLVLKSR